MRKVYESKNKLNVIFAGEWYHYLTISSKDGQKGFACAFDGELIREKDGERHTIAELLGHYIDTHGSFYVDPCTLSRNYSTKKRIEEVLYALYHPDHGAASNIKLANRGRIDLRCREEDEAAFVRENCVIDMSQNNIRSTEMTTFAHTRGVIYQDQYNRIVITYDGKRFYTDYSPELFAILKKISVWVVIHGALRAIVDGGAEVQLSIIVWAFHNGHIKEGWDVYKVLLAIREYMSATGREVDHLTGNRANNHIYALAEMEKTVNASLGDHRNRIMPPYYFYTVYSLARKALLVRCGVSDSERSWTRQFSFDMDEMERYRDCFTAFKERARSAGCVAHKRAEDNLLTYWADPAREQDPRNPLISLLKESPDSFSEYHDGAFDDMPEIMRTHDGDK